MKNVNAAVLGASGLVGRELLKILEREDFPLKNISLLGNKSVDKTIKFKGENLKIESADKEHFKNADIIFGCTESDAVKNYLPLIRETDAYFIDNSSLLRLNEDIPLIVPEINIDEVTEKTRLISNPNCSTIIVLLALFPIYKAYGIKSAEVTTFQSVSGAGKKALDEFLFERENLKGKYEFKPEVLPETIVGNVIPSIGKLNSNLYTDEEMKMQNEGRKILKDKEITFSCTCVRVPVERCHSFSIRADLKKKPDVNKIRNMLLSKPYLREYMGSCFPSPLKMEKSCKVGIGRIRENLSSENSVNLFISSDQLLRGSSYNSYLIGRYIGDNLL